MVSSWAKDRYIIKIKRQDNIYLFIVTGFNGKSSVYLQLIFGGQGRKRVMWLCLVPIYHLNLFQIFEGEDYSYLLLMDGMKYFAEQLHR
jgi:hypothetical protein